MRVISIKTLRDFWTIHPHAMQPLLAWHDEVSKAEWRQPVDIKAHYGNASFVGNNRVVFNIKGNDYRLIVAVSYRAQIVLIKFVGTHAEYNRVDAETVELE